MSELVRDALLRTYGAPETDQRMATLRAIEGLWRDRTDIGDSNAYVRRRRRDTHRLHGEAVGGVLLDSDIVIEILRGRAHVAGQLLGACRRTVARSDGLHLYEPPPRR